MYIYIYYAYIYIYDKCIHMASFKKWYCESIQNQAISELDGNGEGRLFYPLFAYPGSRVAATLLNMFPFFQAVRI